jgi:death-on-curing family protein
MRTQKITIAEIEYIAFRTARELMEYDEPIPEFGSRFPNILESCLAVPFQRFHRRDLYKTFLTKASVLFYLMIKNHPFQNGNKRIAMTTLFIFLMKNKKWLKADNRALYNFAVWVAQSPAILQEEVVAGIERFLRQHLVVLP